MKSNLVSPVSFLYSLCCLVLLVLPSNAQTETPTITPSFTAWYQSTDSNITPTAVLVTATPAPRDSGDGSGDCPPGVLYSNEVPNLYLARCGHCVEDAPETPSGYDIPDFELPTDLPTNTPEPTYTPTSTQTPTITATINGTQVTYTPTYEATSTLAPHPLGDFVIDFNADELSDYDTSYRRFYESYDGFNLSAQQGHLLSIGNPAPSWDADGGTSQSSGNAGIKQNFIIDLADDTYISSVSFDYWIRSFVDTSDKFVRVQDDGTPVYSDYTVDTTKEAWTQHGGSFSPVQGNAIRILMQRIGVGTTIFNTDIRIDNIRYTVYNPNMTATPAPTSTPIYLTATPPYAWDCSNPNDFSPYSDGNTSNPVVDFDPNLSISHTQCYTIIPPLPQAVMDVMGLTQTTETHLCITFYDFPHLEIFGIVFGVELISLMPLAWLIRRLLQF